MLRFKLSLLLVAACALLQGCATPPPDFSELPVYSDNRVGYTLQKNNSSPTRVWTNGDTILALKFGRRVINAKDIESVEVRNTTKPYVPVHIAVRLKSKEVLNADVFAWGNDYSSNVMVEWLACSKDRVCKYAIRKPSPGTVAFESAPHFLISLDERHFDEIEDKSAERYYAYRTDRALPLTGVNARMIFSDVDSLTDFREELDEAKKKKERVTKCKAEAMAENERMRKAGAPVRTGFAATLTVGMHCE